MKPPYKWRWLSGIFQNSVFSSVHWAGKTEIFLAAGIPSVSQKLEWAADVDWRVLFLQRSVTEIQRPGVFWNSEIFQFYLKFLERR